ncbi:transmembrane transport protein [Hydrocarboniphaga effusa AP103]|uniref:Transmembrane transport protein n=2 Tax=Nevskiaceae TaxID=568386 RepID=I8TB70_9GAMM|nr:transmembrane transport protein [Hydrocarboniphaga effusa AP103]
MMQSTMSSRTSSNAAMWTLILCAAATLMITMGGRQSMGLFVAPITQATGIGIVSISFSLAIAQFTWGAVQPVFGAIADQYGARPVIFLGTLLLAAGYALVPNVQSPLMLTLALGLFTAAGAGAGSFSILIGATASELPAEKRSMASGIINAGGSAGQFVFAPLLQFLIAGFGWIVALYSLAAVSLLSLPLLLGLRKRAPQASVASAAVAEASLGAQVRIALRDRSYWLLHAGFFTCGFHIGFLVTHLPGEVSLCGLPASVSATSLALIGLFNIMGSLAAGALGGRYRMRSILGLMYASRALIIAIYLVSPRTPLTFYLFAAALGFSWLATVPPTAGLIGKLFGTRYLGTLFGLTLLSHQTGGFFGAWVGGLTISRYGDYGWMWYADIALAVAAALLCLPIREAYVKPVAQPA